MRHLIVILLFISSMFSADYEYSFSPSSTTSGSSYWGNKILKLYAYSYSGGVKLSVKKYDGGTFSGSGTLYIKVGSYETYGSNWDSASVYKGLREKSFYFDKNFLDAKGDWSSNKKTLYARFENPEGAWAWSGAITITRKDVSDNTKPTGGVSSINSSYTEGDNIKPKLYASDSGSGLKIIRFVIEDSSRREKYNKYWNYSGSSSVKEYPSISTNGWSDGTYYYALHIKDKEDNYYEYKGTFRLYKKADTVVPTGTLSYIASEYKVNESFSVNISASDNEKLSKISFNIAPQGSNFAIGSVSGSWYESSNRFSTTHRVNLSSLTPDTYYYTLWVKDAAGNSKDVQRGNFIVKDVDTIKPTGAITPTLAKEYTTKDSVSIKITANDNKQLSKVSFNVAKEGSYSAIPSVSKSWDLSQSSFTGNHTINMSNLSAGRYYYTLHIKDAFNNLQSYEGKYFDVIAVDEQKPYVKLTMLDSYMDNKAINIPLLLTDNSKLKSSEITIIDSSVNTVFSDTLSNINSDTKSYNLDVGVVKSGSYTLTVQTVDVALRTSENFLKPIVREFMKVKFD